MIKKLLFYTFFTVSLSVFSQKKNIENLGMSPNPFTERAKIHFDSSTDQPVYFTVRNVLGRTIIHKKIEANSGINTFYLYKNNLKPGMYLYAITSNNQVISKRFVIK